MSARLLRFPEVEGRSQGDGAPGFSMWGGSRGSNFMFLQSHEQELRRQGVTCRGRRAAEAPRGGAVGRVPGGSRAPLGSASASREAAWRPGAAAPPGSRPTFKSKWLKPQALGGSPFLLRPVSGLVPRKSRKTPEVREHPSWKGLGGRAWGGALSGGGWGATRKPRLDPDPGARETTTPTSCQRGLLPRRWGGGQGATGVPG